MTLVIIMKLRTGVAVCDKYLAYQPIWFRVQSNSVALWESVFYYSVSVSKISVMVHLPWEAQSQEIEPHTIRLRLLGLPLPRDSSTIGDWHFIIYLFSSKLITTLPAQISFLNTISDASSTKLISQRANIRISCVRILPSTSLVCAYL